MDRLELFSFYDVAKALQSLAMPEGDVLAGVAIWPLIRSRSLLAQLQGGKPLQLGLSKASCGELISTIDAIMNDYLEEVVDGQRRLKFPEMDSQPIPAWRWGHLHTALQTFETVLREELRGAETYHVPRRGIFFMSALVENAHETFPEEIRGAIPPKSLEEWRSAGRCLAFNLLSASGFHVARAVEGTMEAYYQEATGKPAGATLKTWGDYLKELEPIAKKDEFPSTKIISEIVQMKDDYRNPIMHPRVVLTVSDARMLFSNGESLIIGMAQELTEARAKKSNAMLALVTSRATHDEEAQG